MRCFLLLHFSLISLLIQAQPALELVVYADGFDEPVAIANAGDERLFIVERSGHVKIIDGDGVTLPDDFMNISDRIESGYSEQGLLGLVFHPDYASNGFFYVNYTDLDGNTVVSRFNVSADENIADTSTEEFIFTAEQPFLNHNGGCLMFGPDGYLYIGMGDGGSFGDPGNRAQNPENKLGKMMRLDVNGELPYTIPADNPFAGAVDTLPEIWAIGYRNPWRFSFDRLTGDLWVGDVGQNLDEEVDFEPAGSPGGLNYGWRCYEANGEYNTDGCGDESSYIFPIFDYPHSDATGGYAVTGGFVYRGADYPGMYGYYICADFVSGNWWWIHPAVGGGWNTPRIDDLESDISTFGEDVNGELYCADLYSGQIFQVTDACGDFVISGTSTEYICGVQDAFIDLTITSGIAPFNIEWSNGSTDEDIAVDAPGIYSVTVTDDSGCERQLQIEVIEIPAFDVTLNYNADENLLSVDNGNSWQWYLNGEPIDGAVEMNFTPLMDGIYSVLVTDANGCSVMSETIEVAGVAVTDFAFDQAVLMYPNPADDELIIHIAISPDEITSVSVYNFTGQLVYETTMNSELIFSVRDMPAGIYNIQLVNGGDVMSRNIVIGK